MEHEGAAFANDPNDEVGKLNWRATCWEIHPVTGIKLLDNGDDMYIKRDLDNQEKTEINSRPPTNSRKRPNNFGIFFIMLIFGGIIIYLLKKN